MIYISQGIDSDSEQADALVAVHGLIDSLYLKELAKKVKRGSRARWSGGSRPGPDSMATTRFRCSTLLARRTPMDGRRDRPAYPGQRGRGGGDPSHLRMGGGWRRLGTIVERLNREGIPGTRGKRWSKDPVNRILRMSAISGGKYGVNRQSSASRRPVARPC